MIVDIDNKELKPGDLIEIDSKFFAGELPRQRGIILKKHSDGWYRIFLPSCPGGSFIADWLRNEIKFIC